MDLLVKQIHTEFEMSMVGELTYFLGFQIKQLEDGIFISQRKCAKAIVKKFGVKCTPAATHVKFSRDSNRSNVDESLYQSIIGSLLNLIARRPDIAFPVRVSARHQANSKTSHLLNAKKIINYINGTSEYGLLYTFDINSSLVGYCAEDWAGGLEDHESTLGGCFFSGNNLVS